MQGKGKHSEVSVFANSLVTDLSSVGKTMVMPTLNLKIKELFGFDFSDLLAHMNQVQRSTKGRARKSTARTRKKVATKKRR
jgi:hypothetical protein